MCYSFVTILLRVSYFFCTRSSAEFTVNDIVNLLDVGDDLDILQFPQEVRMKGKLRISPSLILALLMFLTRK